MPQGELYINGKDAYVEWGLSIEYGGLSALMTPPPNKELIENKSRNEHGKRVIHNPKIDERDLSLPVHITAKTTDEFMEKYSRFCDELAKSKLDIMTKYRPNEVYKTNYISCSQFSQFRQQMAKFTLKLNEPNPYDRNI